MYKTPIQTLVTLKNGKKIILEEDQYEFCREIWDTIKTYLFNDCCATCRLKTNDLTCIPSATGYEDGSFIINTTWLCRSCALDPYYSGPENYMMAQHFYHLPASMKTTAPHLSHFGSLEPVTKRIRCVFNHSNKLRGGATAFNVWIRSDDLSTASGKINQGIKHKNRLVKPKGMRWDTWERMNPNTAEEIKLLTAISSLNVSCCRKTGPLMPDKVSYWVKKYFVEQKVNWIRTCSRK